MATNWDEDNEDKEDRQYQDSASDDCISPILSQQTLEILTNTFIDPDAFFQIDNADSINQGDSEMPSMTKINSFDVEFITNNQADTPQGSVTRELCVFKEEVSNDLEIPLHIVRMDTPGPSSTSITPFLDQRGLYGFDIYFQESEKPPKSVAWTYSKLEGKLYVLFNTPCPINFIFTSPPPFGCIIRATLYYKDPVDIQHTVDRCPTHREYSHPTNNGYGYPEHLLRCNSLDAFYEKHPETQRCSVIVPYNETTSPLQYNTMNYTFTCYSSCFGSINRRATMVVFTLEHGGLILGRKAVEIRICACPGRDRAKNEQKFKKNDQNATEEKPLLKRSNESEGPTTQSKKSKPPIKISKEESEEMVTVSVEFEVRGKYQAEIYQGILNSIKETVSKHL